MNHIVLVPGRPQFVVVPIAGAPAPPAPTFSNLNDLGIPIDIPKHYEDVVPLSRFLQLLHPISSHFIGGSRIMIQTIYLRKVTLIALPQILNSPQTKPWYWNSSWPTRLGGDPALEDRSNRPKKKRLPMTPVASYYSIELLCVCWVPIAHLILRFQDVLRYTMSLDQSCRRRPMQLPFGSYSCNFEKACGTWQSTCIEGLQICTAVAPVIWLQMSQVGYLIWRPFFTSTEFWHQQWRLWLTWSKSQQVPSGKLT